VFGQMPVIVRVDEGIFASRQPNSAEGVAVANPAIQKQRPDERCQKPAWYFKGNSDDPRSSSLGFAGFLSKAKNGSLP